MEVSTFYVLPLTVIRRGTVTKHVTMLPNHKPLVTIFSACYKRFIIIFLILNVCAFESNICATLPGRNIVP